VKALEDWLSDRGVKNIQALNALLERGAKPWFEIYGGRDQVQALDQAGNQSPRNPPPPPNFLV